MNLVVLHVVAVQVVAIGYPHQARIALEVTDPVRHPAVWTSAVAFQPTIDDICRHTEPGQAVGSNISGSWGPGACHDVMT